VTLVVDSSVVLKWVVSEQDSDHALRLVGFPLVAPDIVRAELANALWKKVRLREELSEEQARRGLSRASAPLRLVPSAPLADRALALGLALSHPVYDCFFLALAEELNTSLITADRRFLQRLNDTPLAAHAVSLEEWTPDA
jgi:predicted nucleic acid-binding protein